MALAKEQVNAFVAALQQQSGCYARMIEMAELQVELLEKDDTQGMQFLLSKKQEVLDEIDGIEMKIKPIKQNWEEVRLHLEAPDLATAEAALTHVRDTLGRLIELEDEWKAIVDSRQSNARERINKLAQGRRMNQAYGVQNPTDPKYMDGKQ